MQPFVEMVWLPDDDVTKSMATAIWSDLLVEGRCAVFLSSCSSTTVVPMDVFFASSAFVWLKYVEHQIHHRPSLGTIGLFARSQHLGHHPSKTPRVSQH